MSGKLLLLPNLLDEELSTDLYLPMSVNHAVASIQGLIAESEKMARRYLRRFLSHDDMAKMPLRVLNEHTQEIDALIEPICKGEIWGLISDAGLPCLADPGADLVWRAHEKAIAVETFVGPSSIIMALQLSGFPAQSFSFHGYLPREGVELELKIKDLEKRKGTHLWIEAPYRSAKMLDTLKRILNPPTRLCVATNLTTKHEQVVSKPVSEWKKSSQSLGKDPAVFAIFA